jgi:dihydroxy-acid dehydratase
VADDAVPLEEVFALHVAGRDAAGGKGIIFNTITISDGISMGTEGMKYSLVSREVIADSIETVVGVRGPRRRRRHRRLRQEHARLHHGHGAPQPPRGLRLWRHDPARLHKGKPVDVVSVFEAVGKHANGKIDDKELKKIEACAIPGPGSCGGMYTANTMASAIEALGMSLPNSSAQAAISGEKMTTAERRCRRHEPDQEGITPRDIMTKKAFENAITVVIALGGSTNAVLHLIAMAHCRGREAHASTTSPASANACPCSPTSSPAAST